MAGNIREEAGSSSRSKGRGESVVVDVGRRRSSCGYCRSGERTGISHGLWVRSITADDYQDLIDRGWRRSGCFLYKPEMNRTCCPSYTIRLKAANFVPSKEQLRVLRRMQRFLDGTLDVKRQDSSIKEPSTSKASVTYETSSSVAKESSAVNCEDKNEEERFIDDLSSQLDSAVMAWTGNGKFPSGVKLPKASVKKVTTNKRKLIEGSEDLLYTSNISFQIAAALRRSQSTKNDVHSQVVTKDDAGQHGLSCGPSPKTIAEMLAHSLNQKGNTRGLSIKACNGHLNFFSAAREASLGEASVKIDASSRSPGGTASKRSCMEKSSKHPQQKKRKLEIRMKRSSFDPEEYALYRRYQIKVHDDSPDEVMESSYRRFLVDSPIVFVPPSGDSTVPPCGFGSFHQQYVIDGKIVAVGVVDILPRCLSSKYLFWDPDLAFLSLGKYSAIQEIHWVKENQASCPSLEYYYLGYYIHTCSKMRYKAAYRPSELLCPLRYQWVPFDIARPLLDKKRYVVLSDIAVMDNGESSLHQVPEYPSEPNHQDPSQENSNDIMLSDEDEEMMDPDFEDIEDDSGPETSGLSVADETEAGDVYNILIGLGGSRMRFKDLQQTLGPTERNYLESQLHGYIKSVGSELSERMVYSLG